jgi:hypothetical protein
MDKCDMARCIIFLEDKDRFYDCTILIEKIGLPTDFNTQNFNTQKNVSPKQCNIWKLCQHLQQTRSIVLIPDTSTTSLYVESRFFISLVHYLNHQSLVVSLNVASEPISIKHI